MKKYLGITTILMVIIVIVHGCAFKPRVRVNIEGELPETFSIEIKGNSLSQRWWETFEKPELTRLVEQAFADNLTLRQAWARLRQIQAMEIQTRSSSYPDLMLSTNVSQSRQRTDNSSNSSTTQTIRNYSMGFVSSYELDLWGRIRSKKEAARMEVFASQEDLNAATMTLAAEIVKHWFNIISQHMQKRLLKKQLEINLTYLDLVKLRFRKSMASALNVYQQQQIVEQVKAKIPLVEADESLLMHELALLLGKPPGFPITITCDALPVLVDIPGTGLPADLLSARPDVRSAGLRLQEADWEETAARADRLPAVRLTANAGYGAGKLNLFFNNWLMGLAANLTFPLFDGKQRTAEVERMQAVADEKLFIYRHTVLNAIKEVEDALVYEEKQRQHIKALKQQINVAAKALNEARERYCKGMNDYLPVLTQLHSIQGVERDMIKQKTKLLINRVSLYRALGGCPAMLFSDLIKGMDESSKP